MEFTGLRNERKRRNKDNLKIICLNARKKGVAINGDGESAGFGGKIRVLLWVYGFKVLNKHLGHVSMEMNIEI